METKKIYFHNPEFVVSNLNVIETEKSVDELKEIGVLTDDCSFLALPKDATVPTTYTEYLTFDDMDNPSEIIYNMDLARSDYLEDIRGERNQILEKLDKIQMRLIGQGRTEDVQKAEKDKEVLRNITESLPLDSAKTVEELYMIKPPELSIDYEYKYFPD